MSIFPLSHYFCLLLLHLTLPFVLTQSTTSTHACSTLRTPTGSVLPTSSADYTLLGCYQELPRGSGGRAVGLTRKYLSPLPPDVVTVPRCLEACGNAQQPDDNRQYPYAALENSRECFCGTTFSNSSILSNPSNCQSECSGDQNTTCGGFGFLELYQLIVTRPESSSNFSALTKNPTTTNITTSETPKSTANLNIPIPSPSPPHISKFVGLAVSISLGVFFFTLLVAGLVLFGIYRYKRCKLSNLQGSLTPAQLASLPSVGGSRSEASDAGDDGQDEQQSEQSYEESSEVEQVRSEGVNGHEVELDTNKAKPRAVVLDKDHVTQNKNKDNDIGKGSNSKKIKRRKTFEAWKSGVVPFIPLSPISTIDLNRYSTSYSTIERRGGVDIRRSKSYTESLTKGAQARDVRRARELGRQARSAGSSLV